MMQNPSHTNPQPNKQNGQYGVANFCISNAIVQAPFVLLIALCCATPVYWMTDKNSDPIR